MKKSTKIVSLLLVSFMLMSSLTACDSGNSGGGNSTGSNNVQTQEQAQTQASESEENADSGEIDVSSVTLTDATGDNFTVGVADGWKLVTAEEIGSFMEGFDWIIKGETYDAMGPYIQIGTTTGNIDEWVEQLKNDIYVKYDKEYIINGVTWYVADRTAGAEIGEKIVTVSPQNGVNLTDVEVQAMMGSIRLAK